jgi:predicted dehydrogenase
MPRPKRAKSAAPERVIRVAFIGAGGRATTSHYPSIRDIPGAEICAIAELDAEKMRKAAEQFGVKATYADYREMIEKERPDVVYAIMPSHHLYDVAFAVMNAGCHLIIEKPPAVTTEQARQMAILARKKGLITGVTLQRRYSPVVRAARKLCEERGPVHTAAAIFYKNTVGGGPYYGGAMDILTCEGIHAVDTLRYLCGGDVVAVASDVRRLLADHFTAYYALVRFSSGATGVLLSNWMAGRRFFTFELHGVGISVFGDPDEGGRAYADNQKEPLRTLDPFELAASKEPYRAFGEYDMNAHFLSCVRRGVQPETNFDDAVKTMELVDRIYQSQI